MEDKGKAPISTGAMVKDVSVFHLNASYPTDETHTIFRATHFDHAMDILPTLPASGRSGLSDIIVVAVADVRDPDMR